MKFQSKVKRANDLVDRGIQEAIPRDLVVKADKKNLRKRIKNYHGLVVPR